MEELFSFFRLYWNKEELFGKSPGSALLALGILYAGTFFYLMDFYALMKRKSKAETFAVLSVPLAVSLLGSAAAGMLVRIPVPAELGAFSSALQSRSLNVMLLLIGAVYWLLWAISLFSQVKKRPEKEIRRWTLSCFPDYIYTAMLFFFTGWRLVVGKSFFTDGRELLLWLDLYAVYFLCCKIILLAAALAIRLYSVRITVFKWREGTNPSGFLLRYYLFYQNALVRNLLLFELGILIPITLALNWEGWTYEGVGMIAFLWLCAVFCILFSAGPVMKSLEKFQVWGEPRHIKELFCHEYFLEDPVFKNGNYTLTRHFLVDEQMPCTIYYLPALKSISGWVIDQKGSSRTMFFLDGADCRILKEEAQDMAPVFEYAKKWQKGNEYAHERIAISAPAQNIYTRIMQFMVMILILAFMIPYLLGV